MLRAPRAARRLLRAFWRPAPEGDARLAVKDVLRPAVASADAGDTTLVTLSRRDAGALLSVTDTHLDAAARCVAGVCVAQSGGTCLLTPPGDIEIRFPL